VIFASFSGTMGVVLDGVSIKTCTASEASLMFETMAQQPLPKLMFSEFSNEKHHPASLVLSLGHEHFQNPYPLTDPGGAQDLTPFVVIKIGDQERHRG